MTDFMDNLSKEIQPSGTPNGGLLTRVKERHILFSGDMVNSILEGRKTQTRRVMRQQPEFDGWMWHFPWGAGSSRSRMPVVTGHATASRCPYGQPGDRLWVRETWQADTRTHPAVDDQWQWLHDVPRGLRDRELFLHTYYRADESQYMVGDRGVSGPNLDFEVQKRQWPPPRWIPSIYMPRWASRILLEVEEVCLERVQEIRRDDAIREGMQRVDGEMIEAGWPVPPATWKNYLGDDRIYPADPIGSFRSLWDSINGKRDGCSWEANPWVWAVTFRRVEP